jgi:hypothetical protein
MPEFIMRRCYHKAMYKIEDNMIKVHRSMQMQMQNVKMLQRQDAPTSRCSNVQTPHTIKTCMHMQPIPTAMCLYQLQRAYRRVALSAEDHLDRSAVDSLKHQALSHFGQSWTGFDLTSVLSRRIFRSGPQDFSCSACPWPNHVVKIDGVGLLGPDVHLTTNHQMGCVGWDAGQRIIRVNQAPVLHG